MSTIEPRLGCLPPSQRKLWPQLSLIGSEFVLYGGTALAWHCCDFADTADQGFRVSYATGINVASFNAIYRS